MPISRVQDYLSALKFQVSIKHLSLSVYTALPPAPVRTASILHEPLAVSVKVQKEKKCVQDLCSRLSLLPSVTVTQAVITGG